MKRAKKASVTIDKESIVEAWVKSAIAIGISPQISAPQLRYFAKLLGLDLHQEVHAYCNRVLGDKGAKS